MQVGSISGAVSAALYGLQSAQADFESALENVMDGDLDLAQTWSAMSLARTKRDASAIVLRTALDSEKSVLDILV